MNCPKDSGKQPDCWKKNCPQPWHREKRIIDGEEIEFCTCPFCSTAECYKDRPIGNRPCCQSCRKLFTPGEGRYCGPDGSLCTRCNFLKNGGTR